jgi:hypothetical protein
MVGLKSLILSVMPLQRLLPYDAPERLFLAWPWPVIRPYAENVHCHMAKHTWPYYLHSNNISAFYRMTHGPVWLYGHSTSLWPIWPIWVIWEYSRPWPGCTIWSFKRWPTYIGPIVAMWGDHSTNKWNWANAAVHLQNFPAHMVRLGYGVAQ